MSNFEDTQEFTGNHGIQTDCAAGHEIPRLYFYNNFVDVNQNLQWLMIHLARRVRARKPTAAATTEEGDAVMIEENSKHHLVLIQSTHYI